MREFKLYPEERPWWSFADYEHVLQVTEELKPERVLEFGPGSSTLALIEGGAGHIVSCEDDPHYEQVYRERLERKFPGRVTIQPYVWHYNLVMPSLVGKHFDLALIDGPKEAPKFDLGLIDGPRLTPRRPAVLEYCLLHCEYVLLPLECDVAGRNSLLRIVLHEAAPRHGRRFTIAETGPLSGAFALIYPKGQ